MCQDKYITIGPSPKSFHLNSPLGSLLGTSSPLLRPGCAVAEFLLKETSRKKIGDSQYEIWLQMEI